MAIDEHGPQPAARGACDVVGDAVADHDRRLGRCASERQCGREDRLAGLAAAVRARGEREVDADPELRGKRLELAIGVRHEADRARAGMQRGKQRKDIREQLEVARVAPLLLGSRADLLGPSRARAHAADDLDREPAMLSAAVLERLDVEDVQCIEARLLVELGIETLAEASAELGVAVRVEHPRWTDQREVDVEQNELRWRSHRRAP